MLSKKSLFLVLLIMARINLILSSMIYESPTGVHEIISRPTDGKLTVSDDEKEHIKLVVGAKSDEELQNSDQELVVTEIIEKEEILVKNDSERQSTTFEDVISQPSVEEVIRSKEKEEKDKNKKLKKWLKFNDSFSYYSLPFAPGDYLPAYKAALKSDLKKLNCIADRGISLETYDSKTGETPLHAACRRGNVEVFKFICSRIKNINNFAALDRVGSTPFSVAVSSGNTDLILFMIRNCLVFKCDLPDNNGRIPLMHAALHSKKPLFTLLINIGQNHLQRENSGRTLLSLILPSNPIFRSLINLISKSMKENKEDTIRAIAEDISVIYESESLGGKTQVDNILSKLGITLEEMITTPQAHQSNPMNAILRSKDFIYYNRLRHQPEYVFEINTVNDYNQYSFLETCLQFGSLDIINYLLTNDDDCKMNYSSRRAILSVDREDVFVMLVENYPEVISGENPVDLIAEAGLYSANKCFKVLLKRFWQDGNINLFCEAAVQICSSYEVEPIINLFDNFAVGLSKCPLSYLNKINYDLGNESMFYRNYEKLGKVLRFTQRLLRI